MDGETALFLESPAGGKVVQTLSGDVKPNNAVTKSPRLALSSDAKEILLIYRTLRACFLEIIDAICI